MVKRIMAALVLASVSALVLSGAALAVTLVCEDFCRGSKKGDVLVGTKTDTTIVGRAGNDKISDTSTQGHDHDTISGGAGKDEIDVRDGDHDNNSDSVDCGRGNDRVFADANDVVAGNCEHVFVG